MVRQPWFKNKTCCPAWWPQTKRTHSAKKTDGKHSLMSLLLLPHPLSSHFSSPLPKPSQTHTHTHTHKHTHKLTHAHTHTFFSPQIHPPMRFWGADAGRNSSKRKRVKQCSPMKQAERKGRKLEIKIIESLGESEMLKGPKIATQTIAWIN